MRRYQTIQDIQNKIYRRQTRHKVAVFFDFVHTFVCVIMCLCSALCLIDCAHTPFSERIMNGVYGVVDFFAPERHILTDDSHNGFVSKMLSLNAEVIGYEGISHIVHYTDIQMSGGQVIYDQPISSVVMSPCQAKVGLVDIIDGSNFLQLNISDSVIITISGKVIFGVQEGDIIHKNQKIGLLYSQIQPIVMQVFRDGVLIDDIEQQLVAS